MVMTDSSGVNHTALRPRNRHQTSHDDRDVPRPAERASRPSASREAPSIDRSHPSSRTPSSTRPLDVPGVSRTQFSRLPRAPSFWESPWSSLQDIASTLIGHDSSRAPSPARDSQRRRPMFPPPGRNTSAPPAQWGPSVHTDHPLGGGTREDSRAMMQARKREELLMATGHTYPGIKGKHKRRDSDDRKVDDVPTYNEEDKDALVYLHKVKPQDTLAGIMIKYNCDANIFRKANRLWPNDIIQVRKVVVLPVDACGVKGRKLSRPEKVSNVVADGTTENFPLEPVSIQVSYSDMHDTHCDKGTPFSSIPTSPSISISQSNSEEFPWRHDSWVMIDGFHEAIEIGRLSRRTLGYFPRGRRKSLTLSDFGSPPASLDLSRDTHDRDSLQQAIKTKSRSSSGSFLQGPGGVGTMGRNVRSPGPAQDGLNKIFAKHLPDVAPRSSHESDASESNHANGIDSVGGAVEGWVRKLASRAASTVQPNAAGERTLDGDLIELSETRADSREVEEVEEAPVDSRPSPLTHESLENGIGAKGVGAALYFDRGSTVKDNDFTWS